MKSIGSSLTLSQCPVPAESGMLPMNVLSTSWHSGWINNDVRFRQTINTTAQEIFHWVTCPQSQTITGVCIAMSSVTTLAGLEFDLVEVSEDAYGAPIPGAVIANYDSLSSPALTSTGGTILSVTGLTLARSAGQKLGCVLRSDGTGNALAAYNYNPSYFGGCGSRISQDTHATWLCGSRACGMGIAWSGGYYGPPLMMGNALGVNNSNAIHGDNTNPPFRGWLFTPPYRIRVFGIEVMMQRAGAPTDYPTIATLRASSALSTALGTSTRRFFNANASAGALDLRMHYNFNGGVVLERDTEYLAAISAAAANSGGDAATNNYRLVGTVNANDFPFAARQANIVSPWKLKPFNDSSGNVSPFAPTADGGVNQACWMNIYWQPEPSIVI